jgi:heme-degrading monooxygenase HmoA
MIERHIPFIVHAGQGAALERFFDERYRPAMSRSPGFVRVDLLRESDDPTRYLMTMRWRDAEAATGWRTSAEHLALQPELNALCSMGEVRVHVVVD